MSLSSFLAARWLPVSAGSALLLFTSLLLAAFMPASVAQAAGGVCTVVGTPSYKQAFPADSVIQYLPNYIGLYPVSVDSGLYGQNIDSFLAVLEGGSTDSGTAGNMAFALYSEEVAGTYNLIVQSSNYEYDPNSLPTTPTTVTAAAQATAVLPADATLYLAIANDCYYFASSLTDYPYYTEMYNYNPNTPLPSTLSSTAGSIYTEYPYDQALAFQACVAPLSSSAASPPLVSSSSSAVSPAPAPSSTSAVSPPAASSSSSAAVPPAMSSSSTVVPPPSKSLVKNGGFESGSFASFARSGRCGGDAVVKSATQAHQGTHFARLGPSPGSCSLTQSIRLKHGMTYQLSFWLANNGAQPNSFTATAHIGTQPAVIVTSQTNVPQEGYREYTATLTAPASGSTKLTLKFTSSDAEGFFRLDSISLTS